MHITNLEERSRIMPREYPLFSVIGLKVTATPSAVISFVGLSVLLVLAAWGLLRLPFGLALLVGIAASVMQYLGELVHNIGHGLAARFTGHPMIGIRLWFVLGTSVYPPDEGDLPASVHVRRALGGPIFSGIIALVCALVLLILPGQSGVISWLVLWFCLVNLLVFSLGALLPLGFTDGSTLLKWLPRLRK